MQNIHSSWFIICVSYLVGIHSLWSLFKSSGSRETMNASKLRKVRTNVVGLMAGIYAVVQTILKIME